MAQTAGVDDVARAPLADRRAFVTGGSRGIGAGIVRRLAADGAAVAFTYRETTGAANDLEQEIIGSGGQALALRADSADPEALRAALPHLGAGGRIISIGSVLADRAPISGISVPTPGSSPTPCGH